MERGKWRERNADIFEAELRSFTEDLVRASIRLGRANRESAEYVAQRKRLSETWRHFERAVISLRWQTEKEAKRATRDALHAKLCGIQRETERYSDKREQPYIAWKRATDSVLEWLDEWAK